MHRIDLLIIEAHPAVRRALAERLAAEPCLAIVAEAASPGELMTLQAPRPHVILYAVTGREALDPAVLDALQNAFSPPPALIVLSSFADIIRHGAVFRPGARRYLLKDINTKDLIAAIGAITSDDPTAVLPC